MKIQSALMCPTFLLCITWQLIGVLGAFPKREPEEEADQGSTRQHGDTTNYNVVIRMHEAVAEKADALVCTSHKLDPEETHIVRIIPHANMTTAHHLVVYGCYEPGNEKQMWNCDDPRDTVSTGEAVCSHSSRQIVYAWANDAPAKSLPEGVGIRVAGKTPIKYLVVQLHYATPFEPGTVDNSGVTLEMTTKRPPQQVGYLILGSRGYIPPKIAENHLDSSCNFHYPFTIYPIGYRTHSHMLGVVTSGYRVRDGEWMEIGRMSPQLPQMFYEVNNPGMDIRKGDTLAARCTMNSLDRDNITIFGPTHWDEMCNFYIMYSTYYQENLGNIFCFSDAQSYQLTDDFAEEDIPDDISSLEGIRGAEKVREKFHMNENKSI